MCFCDAPQINVKSKHFSYEMDMKNAKLATYKVKSFTMDESKQLFFLLVDIYYSSSEYRIFSLLVMPILTPRILFFDGISKYRWNIIYV